MIGYQRNGKEAKGERNSG